MAKDIEEVIKKLQRLQRIVHPRLKEKNPINRTIFEELAECVAYLLIEQLAQDYRTIS
jgi:hypothetical protein